MEKKMYDALEEKYLVAQKEEKRRYAFLLLIIVIVILVYLFGIYVAKLGYGIPTIDKGNIKVLKITQNSDDWNEISDLDIFCNPVFQSKKIIAPGSKSAYTFQIENTLNENTTYDIYFEEVNKYKVNMKYRLKLDNVYVVGAKDKWADVKDMEVTEIIVAAKSKNNYTIEWYWPDSRNDTDIGKKVFAEYKLSIHIIP